MWYQILTIVCAVMTWICVATGGLAAVGFTIMYRRPCLTRDLLLFGAFSCPATAVFTALTVVDRAGLTSLTSLILGGALAVTIILAAILCVVAAKQLNETSDV